MDEMKKFASREEIPLEARWATEDLYATDELWEADLVKMTELGKELASYAGKLGESGATLCAYLTGMEQADVRTSWATTPPARATRTPVCPPTRP